MSIYVHLALGMGIVDLDTINPVSALVGDDLRSNRGDSWKPDIRRVSVFLSRFKL